MLFHETHTHTHTFNNHLIATSTFDSIFIFFYLFIMQLQQKRLNYNSVHSISKQTRTLIEPWELRKFSIDKSVQHQNTKFVWQWYWNKFPKMLINRTSWRTTDSDRMCTKQKRPFIFGFLRALCVYCEMLPPISLVAVNPLQISIHFQTLLAVKMAGRVYRFLFRSVTYEIKWLIYLFATVDSHLLRILVLWIQFISQWKIKKISII